MQTDLYATVLRSQTEKGCGQISLHSERKLGEVRALIESS